MNEPSPTKVPQKLRADALYIAKVHHRASVNREKAATLYPKRAKSTNRAQFSMPSHLHPSASDANLKIRRAGIIVNYIPYTLHAMRRIYVINRARKRISNSSRFPAMRAFTPPGRWRPPLFPNENYLRDAYLSRSRRERGKTLI